MDVVITLLDSDGDWTQSCNDDTEEMLYWVFIAVLMFLMKMMIMMEYAMKMMHGQTILACQRIPIQTGSLIQSIAQKDSLTYLVEDQDDNGDGIWMEPKEMRTLKCLHLSL